MFFMGSHVDPVHVFRYACAGYLVALFIFQQILSCVMVQRVQHLDVDIAGAEDCDGKSAEAYE